MLKRIAGGGGRKLRGSETMLKDKDVWNRNVVTQGFQGPGGSAVKGNGDLEIP